MCETRRDYVQCFAGLHHLISVVGEEYGCPGPSEEGVGEQGYWDANRHAASYVVLGDPRDRGGGEGSKGRYVGDVGSGQLDRWGEDCLIRAYFVYIS